MVKTPPRGLVMPPREINPKLLTKAQSKQLTRSNTRPGTPERQAVDRAAYLQRRSRHPELSARQATGHYKESAETKRISFLAGDPPRYLEAEGLSRLELKRAGRYNDLLSKLDNGRISPKEFQRRVRSWKPIAGEKLLANPDAALAVVEKLRAQDKEIFVYNAGRAT